jgi:hypothetical protein
MKDVVEARDRQRYRLLKAAYEILGPQTNASIDLQEVAERAGISADDAQLAHQYLTNEGLMKWFGHDLGITHEGIREAEDSIRRPDRGTEHFSPAVINIHGNVGAVQTGQGSVAHVSQGTRAATEDGTRELLQRLRDHIEEEPGDNRADAKELVESIEQQVEAGAPKRRVLRALTESLITVLTTPKAIEAAAELMRQMFT